MITNIAGLSKELKAIESQAAAMAKQINDPVMRDSVLTGAAQMLVNEMQNRAPVATKPVHRYKNGKRIATYTPGNLKRAISIIQGLRDKSAKYAGVTKGKNVKDDAYYAHFVEYGKHKRPFIRPAVAAVGHAVLRHIQNYIDKVTKLGSS